MRVTHTHTNTILPWLNADRPSTCLFMHDLLISLWIRDHSLILGPAVSVTLHEQIPDTFSIFRFSFAQNRAMMPFSTWPYTHNAACVGELTQSQWLTLTPNLTYSIINVLLRLWQVSNHRSDPLTAIALQPLHCTIYKTAMKSLRKQPVLAIRTFYF